MNPIPVRVLVLDTWDEITFEVPPTALVSDLKTQALEQARVTRPAHEYQVKFRGALVPEGESTMADVGVVPNAGLIVMGRRRVAAK